MVDLGLVILYDIHCIELLKAPSHGRFQPNPAPSTFLTQIRITPSLPMPLKRSPLIGKTSPTLDLPPLGDLAYLSSTSHFSRSKNPPLFQLRKVPIFPTSTLALFIRLR